MADSTNHGGKRENSGRKAKYRSQSKRTSIYVPEEYRDAVYEFLEWLDRETYPITTNSKAEQYIARQDNQN